MRASCYGLVAAVLLGWAPAAVVADNYVPDGGFETPGTSGVLSPTIPGDLIYVFGVGGATNIGLWSVTSSVNNNGSTTPLSVLVTGEPPQVPASGSYTIDFDPFWNVQTGSLLGPTVTGTLPQISQVIQLPAGEYVLSFDAAIEQNGGAGTRSVLVTLNGGASLSETPTTSRPDNTGYDFFSYNFSSNGSAVTLTFIPDDFSPEPNFMLDNVSITSVPEPSTIILMGISGLALALYRRT
jgi:PEP-CTERM motif